MSAFLVAFATVDDPAAFEGYKPLAAEALARHSGRYLARGGDREDLEGRLDAERVVLIEFADAAAARRFYHSPEYAAARRARAGAARYAVVLVGED